MQRADTALRILGVATEVLRGQQPTRAERLTSRRVSGRGRDWASVWAKHNDPFITRLVHKVKRSHSHAGGSVVKQSLFRGKVATTRHGRGA